MSREIKAVPSDSPPSVSGRTVEITDEDESLVVSFIPVDSKKPQPLKGN